MKLQALLFLLSVNTSLAQNRVNITRDGPVSSIPGWGISYYAVRWEPLCGTITALPSGPEDHHAVCINAMESYIKDNNSTVALYDDYGFRMFTGVGMGRSGCLCFALSTTSGTAYRVCWYFSKAGQYQGNVDSIPYGSYRPNATQSLQHCEDVDVGSLQAAWTHTAILPMATGGVGTETQVSSSTLFSSAPTSLSITTASSTVFTDLNDQLTTGNHPSTTAAPIQGETAPESGGGLTTGDKIALGIGIGIGLPTLLVGLVQGWHWWCKERPTSMVCLS